MSETTEVSAEIINSAFVDKIERGLVKEAEEAGSNYIRQALYEEGVTRKIIAPQTKTAEDLDPDTDSDKPRILVELEPNAPSATFVPFKGTADRSYFTGKRFPVPFGKVESERQNKSKFELMTIRMPIMDWFKQTHVKQIQGTEDGNFLGTVKENIAANSSNLSTTVTLGTDNDFKDAFMAGVKGLYSLKLPTGVVLMNKNTYIDSTKLKTDSIGFEAQDKRFKEGIEGEEQFYNYRVVTTIESDKVAENEMYFFAPEEYLGKFYLLQDATLFIKTEADMMEFFTYEAPGIGIGNTNACFKVTLG